jgi:hypothetical protein
MQEDDIIPTQKKRNALAAELDDNNPNKKPHN